MPYWFYGTQNWVYVMLSRVKTHLGLFIGQNLDSGKSFETDPRIISMLDMFCRDYQPEKYVLEE